MTHGFIALMLLFTIYGQLVLKWKVTELAPEGLPLAKPMAMATILLNPWILSAFFAAFLASVCWMAALSRMPLSKAFPFTAVSFPLILFLSWWLFREPISAWKIVGTLLICLGILFLSKG